MSNCCLKAVPHSDSSFETLAGPVAEWTARLMAGLTRSVQGSDENLGHLEEEILHQTRGWSVGFWKKRRRRKPTGLHPVSGLGSSANAAHGGSPSHLSDVFWAGDDSAVAGLVSALPGLRFSGRRCLGLERYWQCLALGAGDGGSGGQQAAGGGSQRGAAAVDGREIAPATLDREARRQGRRAERKRLELDEQMRTAQGAEQMQPRPAPPFPLVIELDAWNICERDDWGQSAALRRQGQEPERWHWVYGGTCFGLDQRVETAWGRPCISSRGTVMTRQGVAGLREQLFAEAQRHGLAQAARVLVVADGAVWIWNLTGDRFGKPTSAWTATTPANTFGRWRTPCIRTMSGPRASGSSRCSGSCAVAGLRPSSRTSAP